MGALGPTTIFGRLAWPQVPAPAQFHPEPEDDVSGAVQSTNADKPAIAKRTEARAAPNEISFGPFRLLPTQFLLLEGDKPVPLGSRALEILLIWSVIWSCPDWWCSSGGARRSRSALSTAP